MQQRIGQTPFIEINSRIYAKDESVNPSGSIKDRMAAFILDEAERRGEIDRGQYIVEATSGNTGIAFSRLAAERGYKMIVVMPSDMSQERKNMIRSYGAAIVEVQPGDFAGACKKRDDLIQELHAFNPDQFKNPDNVRCHQETTAREFLQQLQEKNLRISDVTAFIAGTGTGGTLMGVAKALRALRPEIAIVAVEPRESAVMSGGKPDRHSIQGIGDGFIPPIVAMDEVDIVLTVSSIEAIACCRKLNRENGLQIGISSGANVAAAKMYLEKYKPEGVILTVLPDHLNRYLSIMNSAD